MVPDLYRIVDCEDGFLAILRRPGPESLPDEIAALAGLGVTTLVSLLEHPEARDLGLDTEAALAARNGIDFVSFPIEDREIPGDLEAFAALTRDLAGRVLDGQGVAIHCRAGIGRSGITAAAVLVGTGYDAENVFARIAEARGRAVPDTIEQQQWFRRHHRRFVIAGPDSTN